MARVATLLDCRGRLPNCWVSSKLALIVAGVGCWAKTKTRNERDSKKRAAMMLGSGVVQWCSISLVELSWKQGSCVGCMR